MFTVEQRRFSVFYLTTLKFTRRKSSPYYVLRKLSNVRCKQNYIIKFLYRRQPLKLLNRLELRDEERRL